MTAVTMKDYLEFGAIARIISPEIWVRLDHAVERFHLGSWQSSKYGGPSYWYELAYVGGALTESETIEWLITKGDEIYVVGIVELRESLLKAKAVYNLIKES